MSLSAYNKKRDFSQTAEPKGVAVKPGKQLKFVVQRHEASHLHYDFRLEMGGTLRSWAVPKGPSLYPRDRRLAVEVEDHPVSYAAFEGDIPAGNYGAGHVDIWDKGTYQPINERGEPLSHTQALKSLQEGQLRFTLSGKKLKGGFRLFRMKEEEKNWLLLKSSDEHATDGPFDIEAGVPEKRASVKRKEKVVQPDPIPDRSKFNEFIHPMMARLHDAPFDDDGWIYEIKWDGYRAIAECNGAESRLYSRNGLSFSADYPAVDAAVRAIARSMVIDGEIVAFNEDGHPEFQLLQAARSSDTQLLYYVFDLLALDGESVEHHSTLERKALLEQVLPQGNVIRYCDHVAGEGTAFFSVMQQRGLEGMIAKRGSAPYVEGRRSPDWLKVKHLITDEAVICGYTAPKGARTYFGALILGVYSDGELQYIGHTGTGFDTAALKTVYDAMQPLRNSESPFAKRIRVNAPVTWLVPELVCAVRYTEVTKDGIRRHPAFIGLRKDKTAYDVDGADAGSDNPKRTKGATRSHPRKTSNDMDTTIRAGNQRVTITNKDKIFWPEEGFTKGDVAEYYNAVSRHILPYLKGRPMSLRRNPNGISDEGFFHKDAGEHTPDWVHTKVIRSESAGRDTEYIICDNKATLLYLANLGCIELNPWHSRVGKPEYPGYLIIDLDPSDENGFEQVVETAKAVKEVADSAGILSVCKTSGATGLHIYIPMGARYTYEQVNSFAHILALRTHALVPDFTSLERSLKKRGPNIYIDYMQNNIGQTVAAPYSLRPRPQAPVSAPLDWKEVRRDLDPLRFNIRSMAKRLSDKGDLFKKVLGRGINMQAALKRLGD